MPSAKAPVDVTRRQLDASGAAQKGVQRHTHAAASFEGDAAA